MPRHASLDLLQVDIIAIDQHLAHFAPVTVAFVRTPPRTAGGIGSILPLGRVEAALMMLVCVAVNFAWAVMVISDG